MFVATKVVDYLAITSPGNNVTKWEFVYSPPPLCCYCKTYFINRLRCQISLKEARMIASALRHENNKVRELR